MRARGLERFERNWPLAARPRQPLLAGQPRHGKASLSRVSISGFTRNSLAGQTWSDQNKGVAADMNITEVKARLSEIVDRVQTGEDVIITRMGRPVARLTAHIPADASRRFGFMAGKVELPEGWDEWPDDEARALGIVD